MPADVHTGAIVAIASCLHRLSDSFPRQPKLPRPIVFRRTVECTSEETRHAMHDRHEFQAALSSELKLFT